MGCVSGLAGCDIRGWAGSRANQPSRAASLSGAFGLRAKRAPWLQARQASDVANSVESLGCEGELGCGQSPRSGSRVDRVGGRDHAINERLVCELCGHVGLSSDFRKTCIFWFLDVSPPDFWSQPPRQPQPATQPQQAHKHYNHTMLTRRSGHKDHDNYNHNHNHTTKSTTTTTTTTTHC